MGTRYKDQVVIVTGGGRGIGRAIALKFASEGATCVLAGRRMDALHLAVRECHEAGGSALAVKCDVAQEADLAALVEMVTNDKGRIDVLVNNAGVITGGRLDEMDREDIGRMVSVNVWAPLRLTQLVLPHMRKAKGGTIVNVSSIAGRLGVPFYAVYSATKYSMRGFSEALRREVRPDGIHVMAVYPGVTATDMMESAELPDMGALGGISTAESVAQAVMRGMQWHLPDVYVGVGETLLSRANDWMPWTVDWGVSLMREQFHNAVRNQRTT
jgi:NAD(P)-dependent dehydrogenase (short-subunit alcohol dehydrogenase family)